MPIVLAVQTTQYIHSHLKIGKQALILFEDGHAAD